MLASKGLTVATEPGQAALELYGVMCDGSLVMGCTELDGGQPDKSDLDAQNGHVHAVAAKDPAVTLPEPRYHVHICPTWTDKPRRFTPEVQFYDRCTVQ